jgi:hypothetical protein
MASNGTALRVIPWTGIIGSCNWLLSPFRRVEFSAVINEPHAVARQPAR